MLHSHKWQKEIDVLKEAETCAAGLEKLKHTKKTNADRGHDASSQQRMKICVLAAQGASIREIVESLGYTKYMAVRSSKRFEEVMKTSSVESKPKKNADTSKKLIYSTPGKTRIEKIRLGSSLRPMQQNQRTNETIVNRISCV